MLKKLAQKIVKRYGVKTICRFLLIAAIAVSTIITIIELARPIKVTTGETEAAGASRNELHSILPEMLKPKTQQDSLLSKSLRSGLFRPTSGLQDKPMAEQTIEKIKSQLKLQCIMQMNGQPVAYVNINSVGLKKCKIGDTINDLFTVVDILKDRIEIKIIGHQVSLTL
jgi:hypothetical protein